MGKKNKKQVDIFDAVDQFMLGLQGASKQEFRQPRVRASSMPFCPLLFTLNTGHGEVPYRSGFYFGIGTEIHKEIQEAAHRNEYGVGHLWGDWKCVHCIKRANGNSSKVKVAHSHCLKPTVICTECRANEPDWEYEEVTVEYNGISGHIDTILKYGDHYYIVDYKTTGKPYNGARLDAKKYPFRGNVIQISFYAYVMKEKYGLDVRGISLIYVDRAKPIDRTSDYVHVHQEWTKYNHKTMGKRIDWISERIPHTLKMWDTLHNKGEMPSKKDIETLVENRPCTNKKKWDRWMFAAFERGFVDEEKVCPNLEHCLGGCKQAMSNIKQQYKEILGQ